MIQSISLINSDSELLEIPLVGADTSSPLMVINIEGIGGPEATINTLGSPRSHGSRFNSSKVTNRDIKMQLVVQGAGQAEEDARQSLYNWFPPSKPVTFQVTTDVRTIEIQGHVSQNTINMFAQHENADIAFECPQPFFRNSVMSRVMFGGTVPKFTFPFSNDSLVDDLLIFGEELSYIARDIQYEGHIETGVDITLHFIGPVTGDISIYNPARNQVMIVDTGVIENILGSPIQAGDEIYISTQVGDKSVTAWRSGNSYNALKALDRYPKWIELFPGKNTIVYTADTGQDKIQMVVDYYELFMGV